MVDKAADVADLRGDRIVAVGRPVGVAVAALVERDAVEIVAQRQAAQIPGMRGQRPAVQEQDRLLSLAAPIQIVHLQLADADVALAGQHDVAELEPGADGRRGKVLAVFLGGQTHLGGSSRRIVQGISGGALARKRGVMPAAMTTQAGYAPCECEAATPDRRTATARVRSRHPAEPMISGGTFRHRDRGAGKTA